MNLRLAGIACVAAVCFAFGSSAKEIPIGEPQVKEGLRVAAVYLQPVEIDQPSLMRDPKDSDLHFEADVTTAKGNPWGLEEGTWFPGLAIHYKISRVDDGKSVEGNLTPDIASDGFAYCNNIKLPGSGAGKYKVVLTLYPPSAKSWNIARHVDKENAAAEWFKPFSTEYEFVFAGTGKKGAY